MIGTAQEIIDEERDYNKKNGIKETSGGCLDVLAIIFLLSLSCIILITCNLSVHKRYLESQEGNKVELKKEER